MNRQNILKTAIMLAATLLIAACTNDETADSQPETLPEGMYPLTFTATQADVVASPQTRVTDFDEGGVHKSKWTDGDKIEVIVKGGGNDTETTCTLKEDGSIDSNGPQVYWKTTQESTINAWYSNIEKHSTTNSTVSLANQSKGLAYVLKAGEVADAKYNSPNISLNFKHQLAKVRVKLEKGNYSGTLENITVKVKGYTSCTIDEGTITAPTSVDYISTIKNGEYYEANLVPQESVVLSKFIQLNDITYAVTTDANVSGITNLEAGLVYSITLEVNQKELDPATANLNSISGCVTIKGNTQSTSNPITITDNAEVTIQDVNINVSADKTAAITVNEGKHLKLIVSGKNNKLSSQNWGGIILENDASIEIVGTDKVNSSLTVMAGDNNESGASTVGIGAKQNVACGNISISNVALTVTGGDILPGSEIKVGAAAIGTSSEPPSGFGTKCGTITITNASVNATGGAGAAAIGIGSQAYGDVGNTLTCGIIKIEKSEVIVTIKPSKAQNYGAGIGTGFLWGATVNCGKIILDKSSGELETFTAKWAKSETGGNSTYKIGKGYIYREGTVTFDGVYLKGNNTEKADYSDGWGSWP